MVVATLVLLAAACDGSSAASDGGPADAAADADDAEIAAADAGDAADSAPDAAPPGVSVPLQGCPTAGYWTTVTLSGSQTYAGLVETADGTSAFAVASCTTCASDGVGPLVSLGPPAVDQQTKTSEMFGAGDSWSGEVYADTFAVGGAPSVTLKVGAITSEHDFFDTSPPCDVSQGNFQGTLGLGASFSASGTERYADAWSSNAFADVVAIESCEQGGTMWLGGFDTSAAAGATQYTPLSQAATGDQVTLASVQVGGATVTGAAIPNVLVAAEIPGLYLPTAVYDAAVQHIDSVFEAEFGGEPYGPTACVTATSGDLAALPSLTLVFPDMANGTVSITVPASQSYLQKSGAQYCATLFDGGTSAWVSPSAMRSHVVIMDRASSRLGLAPQTSCP